MTDGSPFSHAVQRHAGNARCLGGDGATDFQRLALCANLISQRLELGDAGGARLGDVAGIVFLIICKMHFLSIMRNVS